MIDQIVNDVIKLASKKPQYRSRLISLLKKTARMNNFNTLAEQILYRSIPVLGFKKIPDNIKIEPSFLQLVKIFSRFTEAVVNQYWLENKEEMEISSIDELLSDKGIFNIFMLCLEQTPIRWLRANDRQWLNFFNSDVSLEDFIRHLKKNPMMRRFITDTGEGLLGKAILNSVYKAGGY